MPNEMGNELGKTVAGLAGALKGRNVGSRR